MQENYSSTIMLLGEYNGSLYYNYDYFDGPFDGTNISTVNHYSEIHSYNITSKNETELDLLSYGNDVIYGCIVKNEFIYKTQPIYADEENSKSELLIYNLDNHSTYNTDTIIWGSPEFADDKIMHLSDNGMFYYYNINNRKMNPLNNEVIQNFYIMEESEDYLFGTNKEKFELKIIKKSDYYSGINKFITITNN